MDGKCSARGVRGISEAQCWCGLMCAKSVLLLLLLLLLPPFPAPAPGLNSRAKLSWAQKPIKTAGFQAFGPNVSKNMFFLMLFALWLKIDVKTSRAQKHLSFLRSYVFFNQRVYNKSIAKQH